MAIGYYVDKSNQVPQGYWWQHYSWRTIDHGLLSMNVCSECMWIVPGTVED